MTAPQLASGFTARDAITAAVVVIILAFCVWLKVAVDITGTVVSGELVGKREAIEMPLSDTWRHLFEISDRYRPLGASFPATGRHRVDVELCDRLRVGSPVNVRYVRLPLVGRVFGLESAIADSSWWSREPRASESERELVEAISIVIAALWGLIAYRRNSRPLGLVAVTAGATVTSSVLTAAALYYRIPWPLLAPSGPQGHATAVVRAVHSVDQIWGSWGLKRAPAARAFDGRFRWWIWSSFLRGAPSRCTRSIA